MTKQGEICVYCCRTATTRDHVPPDSYFTNPKPPQLITVPSCFECNNQLSNDEEYFRAFLTSLAHDTSDDARMIFKQKTSSYLKRNRGILSDLLTKMDLVELVSSEGLLLGEKTRIHVTVDDWSRYHGVMDKVARGLYWYSYGDVMPQKAYIRHFLLNNESLKKQEKILSFLNYPPEKGGVFRYGHGRVPNVRYAVFLSIFYKTVPFLSFISQAPFEQPHS